MKKNVKWINNIYKLVEERLKDNENINLENYNYIESIDLMEKGYPQKIYYKKENKNNIFIYLLNFFLK